eukprot:Hpha_TRINITY_DN16977_c0_g4::TRINITY_DN16977_c0_g4_i3::g.56238::m.56238
MQGSRARERLSSDHAASVAVCAAHGSRSLAMMLGGRLAGLTNGEAGDAAAAVSLGPRRPSSIIEVEQQCCHMPTKGTSAKAEKEAEAQRRERILDELRRSNKEDGRLREEVTRLSRAREEGNKRVAELEGQLAAANRSALDEGKEAARLQQEITRISAKAEAEAETQRREYQRMLDELREEQRKEVGRLQQQVTDLSEARERVKELEVQLDAASRRARNEGDEAAKLQQEVNRLCDEPRAAKVPNVELPQTIKTGWFTPGSHISEHADADDEDALCSTLLKEVRAEYFEWCNQNAEVMSHARRKATEANANSFFGVVKGTRKEMKAVLNKLDKIYQKCQPVKASSKFSVGIDEVDLDTGYTEFFKGASTTRGLLPTVSEALGKAEGWVVCKACNAGVVEKNKEGHCNKNCKQHTDKRYTVDTMFTSMTAEWAVKRVEKVLGENLNWEPYKFVALHTVNSPLCYGVGAAMRNYAFKGDKDAFLPKRNFAYSLHRALMTLPKFE